MSTRGALPALIAALLAPAAARADPPLPPSRERQRAGDPDPGKRDAVLFLYNRARELMEGGAVREACARLEDGKVLDPTAINLLMRLGECYERLGRLVSARAAYLEAARTASDQRDAREGAATVRARAVAAQIPRLTLVLPPEADRAGLAVRLDGREVARADLGAEQPVDAGDHTLDLRAPGAVARTMAVTVGGAGERVVVTLPRLDDVPTPPESGSVSARRGLGIALGSLGLAGLGVGAGLGVRALADHAASNRGHCDARSFCDETGFALRSRARRLGDGATAAILTGGAALAGGAVLFFTARRALGPVAAFVGVAPGALTLGLRGAF